MFGKIEFILKSFKLMFERLDFVIGWLDFIFLGLYFI